VSLVRLVGLFLLTTLVALVACGGSSNRPDPQIALPVVHGDTLGAGPKAPLGSPENDAAVPVDDDDPTLGSRQALVTIVEFTDFQCPFCARGYATLERVLKEYPADVVRVVFKNEPLSFHPMARPAAETGIAIRDRVGIDAFWRFYRLVFENQKDLDEANLQAWAAQVGLPASALRDARHQPHVAAKLDRDHEVGDKVGVNGTPAFFINGIALMGAQPYEKFKQAIDAQIAAAKDALAKGTDRDKLYRTLAAANFKLEPDDDDPVDPTVWKAPVGTSPARGPATAPVTMVVFGDFQCPFCKKAEATVKAVAVKYGQDLRIVWKNFPLDFHARAVPAAMLALEARAEKGDAGFWDAHDRLFDAADLEDATLEAIAKAMGLDDKKVKDAIAKKKYQSVIDADQDLGDDVGISGTPHFLINGRALGGNQPLNKFIALIDEEMGKAKAKIATGTSAADYYADLMKSAQALPAPVKVTVPPLATAPVRGPANAPVTIVAYGGYQDPYSRKASATLKDLLAAFPGKVKLQWRQDPLSMHTLSHVAAEATVEAFKQKGADGFWKMHDLFMATPIGTQLERADLDAAGKTVGLDAKKLGAALDSGAHAAAVDADIATATTLGITGTPQFYVNGYPISGAQPYRKFRRLVERALAEAQPPKAGKKP
jgi:protein-disulfide isomerase